tara:strand:- start:279 stop:428 length:150 start_codon:yes stop_codon:yes gene_type:complete
LGLRLDEEFQQEYGSWDEDHLDLPQVAQRQRQTRLGDLPRRNQLNQHQQ